MFAYPNSTGRGKGGFFSGSAFAAANLLRVCARLLKTYGFANANEEVMTYSELNYMRSVKRLSDGDGTRMCDMSGQMSVSRVSVFRAVERLEKGGFLTKDRNRRITLTEKGEETLGKYEIVIGFLVKKLVEVVGFGVHESEEEATRIACVLSDVSLERISNEEKKRAGKHEAKKRSGSNGAYGKALLQKETRVCGRSLRRLFKVARIFVRPPRQVSLGRRKTVLFQLSHTLL